MTTWVQYKPEGNDYIPVSRWGKDHWSTLAYLETCAVDHKGQIDNRRMRCNARLHREFAGYVGRDVFLPHGYGQEEYPTILKDGELPHHDDWSCLEDMAAAGLLEAEFTESRPGFPFGDSKGRIRFTEKGLAVAASLRAHKANGGTFGTFSMEVSE